MWTGHEGPLFNRGCDDNRTRDDIQAHADVAIIPLLKTSNVKVSIDDFIYAVRNLIERASIC